MHTPGIVPLILPAHILAGGLALAFGYVALYATKGATLHRKSGMLFVYAMVTMSLSGALMDALKTSRISINVVAGLLTFYLVTTALLTVRNGVRESRWIDATAMLFALTVSVLAFKAGFELSRSGRPEAAPSFMFGIVGLLAAAGDIRMMRAGGIQAPRRIARHLWRMCLRCGLPPPHSSGARQTESPRRSGSLLCKRSRCSHRSSSCRIGWCASV